MNLVLDRTNEVKGDRLVGLFNAGGALIVGISSGLGALASWENTAELVGSIIAGTTLVSVALAISALSRPSKKRALTYLGLAVVVAAIAYAVLEQRGFDFVPILAPFAFAALGDVAYLVQTDGW